MGFLASLLEKFEDDHAFEAMCIEVLQREGYSQIEPLGGSGDKGRDAECRVFSGKAGDRVVFFQFTLQGNFRGKVRQTLQRLREANKRANTVIFVFSRNISPTIRDQLVQSALDQFGQDSELKDQRFLVSRLNQTAYRDVTQRYFAKDIAELRALWQEDALFQDASELQEQERRILANLIQYAKHPYSGSFKEELVRQTIRGVLFHASAPMQAEDLFTEISSVLPASLGASRDDMNAQLQRLRAEGDVSEEQGKFSLLPGIKTQVELDIAGIIMGRRKLYSQVLSHFRLIGAVAPSDHEIRQVTLQFFASLFRKYGTEIANAILDRDNDELITALGHDTVAAVIAGAVPKTWAPVAGDAFRIAVRNVFSDPAEDVMAYLDRLSRSYVLMQVLNVDPNALNAQRTRMRESVALLDTDVVLTALLDGASRHACSMRIIELCAQLGVKCYAGLQELKEIVNRIERSIKLYNDLGRPAVIPSDKADLITDLFLSIYYDQLKAGKVRSFDEFIGRYYDVGAPQQHIQSLIEDDLGVEVRDINAFLLIAQNDKIRRIQDSIEAARKFGNRYKHTDLYKYDAVQLVAVEQQNRDAMAAGRAGRWFLVSGDGFSFRAYLEHKNAFKVKPSVHPVHFLEMLRHTPQAIADESTFGSILHSETMLLGTGRDYAPILASLGKVGVNALALPRVRLLELVEDMDRADFTQWLYKIWGEGEVDAKVREEISAAIQKVIAESQSRDDEVKSLRSLLERQRARDASAQPKTPW